MCVQIFSENLSMLHAVSAVHAVWYNCNICLLL